MKIMYAAEFLYSELTICKVTLARETEKTIFVSKREYIYGSHMYFGTRTRKDTYRLFDTKREAIEWGMGKIEDSIISNQKQIATLNSTLLYLSELKETNND